MNQKISSVPNKTRLIAWIFIAFFSTFICVNIAYITIAEKTWRGIATEDSYQKGLKYNQVIEAIKEQNKLGWQLLINYQFEKTGSGILSIELLDKNGQTIKNAFVTALIKRPLQEGKDFSIDLKFDRASKSYVSAVKFPMIGQWSIEIIAKKNNCIYQNVKRLIIKDQ